MAFVKLSLIALVAASLPVVRADYNSDVDNALTILHDHYSDLATDFCYDYTEGIGYGASTTTVTKAPTTTTVTVPCTYSSPWYSTYSNTETVTSSYSTDSSTTKVTPWISTVSSTTTMWYTTTLTTYVPAITPVPFIKRRSTKPLLRRDEFCDDEGVPCRLVQYPEDVIVQACIEYLGGFDVVTTTTTGAMTTVTVPAATCKPTDGYYQPDPKPDYPEEEDPEEEYPEEEYPEEEYPEEEYPEEETPEEEYPEEDYPEEDYPEEYLEEGYYDENGGEGEYGYDGQDDDVTGELAEESEG